MSKGAKGSAKKPLFNEASELLYNPFPGFVIPDYFPFDLPFPEWSDSEVNAEKWDEGKGKTPKSPKSSKSSKSGKSEVGPPPVYFEDPKPPPFPPGLDEFVHAWKRPSEVFTNRKVIIYDPSNAEFELCLPSPYVQTSELFKKIIEMWPLVQFYALKEGFPVEGESSTYVPNTQGQPWRPWHHIYAMNKAGKGQSHKPLLCTYGKYIVRLFYMGAWRKIIVDDRIPLDSDGTIMLPVTNVHGELWPIILSKALLKIAALTPTRFPNAMDLNFLNVFFGWASGVVPTVSKTQDEIWRWLWALSPHYEYPPDENAPKTPVTAGSRPGSAKSKSKSPAKKGGQATVTRPCFIIGNLRKSSTNVTGVEYHRAGFFMCRDIPLIKVPRRPDTQTWKRLRWVYWAYQKGQWTDELLIPPYRCVFYFTYIRRLHKLLFIDPKLEFRLFEITEEIEPPPPAPATGGALLLRPRKPEDSPLQWCDFTKLAVYLSSIETSYKPLAFPFKLKVTHIRIGPVGKTGAAGGKGAAKTPAGLYVFSPSLTLTQNEPPFLFCESNKNLFICFSLSVCPTQPIVNRYGNYLANNQPRTLKVYRAALTIERYNWWTSMQGEILADLKTVGNGICCLYLNPGRHVMRMWLDTDSSYVVQIYSDVEVTIFRGTKIRFMMVSESPVVTDYINLVSLSFIGLTQKFGKADHKKSLKDFYKAILPGNDKIEGYRKCLDEFIEVFFERIVKSLRALVVNDEDLRWMLAALRCLFINPRITYPLPKPPPGAMQLSSAKTPKKGGKSRKRSPPPVLHPRTLSQVLGQDYTPEEIMKITRIQKVYRGFKFRSFMKKAAPGSKDYKFLSERLKKVVELLFSPAKRELEVGKLIREIIMDKPELLQAFRFHNDIPNVIKTEEFTGSVLGVPPFAWVPMVRFIFSCHSDISIPCAFFLSCNLEQCCVIVIDNDTREEMFRIRNTTAPCYYKKNINGFTLLAYGWNEGSIKTVNWKLEMVSIKYFQTIHPCNALTGLACSPYRPPILVTRELKNFYVPNHRFRICKCLIKIRKRVLLTIRLSTSHKDVKFTVKITHTRMMNSLRGTVSDTSLLGEDDIIAEGDSTKGAVVFPAMLLEYYEPKVPSWWGESAYEMDDATVYTLEATVRFNTWPLTSREWAMVEPIRTGGELWPETASTSNASILSRKSSASRKKSTVRLPKRLEKEATPIENPFWLLQIVSDALDEREGSEQLIAVEDQTHNEAVKVMKISWEDSETGRRKRGRILREEFLRMIHIEEKERLRRKSLGEAYEESYDDEDFNMEGEQAPREDSFDLQIQQMKSFTYLLNDVSLDRKYVSPRVLPRMPTKYLLEKHGVYDKDEEPVVKSTDSVADFLKRTYSDARMYIEGLNDMEMERRSLSAQATHRRLVLESLLMSEHVFSCEMMADVTIARQKVIQRIKKREREAAAAAAATAKPPDTKKKK